MCERDRIGVCVYVNAYVLVCMCVCVCVEVVEGRPEGAGQRESAGARGR